MLLFFGDSNWISWALEMSKSKKRSGLQGGAPLPTLFFSEVGLYNSNLTMVYGKIYGTRGATINNLQGAALCLNLNDGVFHHIPLL